MAKNSDILSKMDREVVRKFEEKQLQYVRYLPDESHREYLNWQHVFRTENRKVFRDNEDPLRASRSVPRCYAIS